MSDRYGHKHYQQETLTALGAYLRRARELGDPALAYSEGLGVPYNTIHELPNGERMPSDMPFVCLRVPTGGGKTVIGARAVKVVRDALLDTDHPLVLWLVPADAIRVQTLEVMRDRRHPLREILDEELGSVEILDGDEALNVTPAVLNGGAVIMVATIQAFRVEKTEGRRVYGNNGQLMGHFDFIAPEIKDRFPKGFPHSLANVLRLRRPLVIVDEAHNARSPLSMEVLERFQPRAIVELTATPETKDNSSNVLYSVSAAELKAEHMVKLPIVLEAQTGFKEVMASAIAMRSELENDADAERLATQEYIRPILLLQAEPHDKDRPDALTVEVLEKSLREEHHIPAEQIAVATGKERGLEGKDLNDENCPIRFVITQSTLKEGWDCPFAYVLCSVATLRSATAVEQILGRILRMPNAKPKQRPSLNRAYAFVRSPHFYVAAELLRDRLVKSAGFNAQEAREFFIPRHKQQSLDFEAAGRRSITVTLPEIIQLDSLTPAARQVVSNQDETKREVTLTGRPSKAIVEALVAAVDDPDAKEILRAAAEDLRGHETIMTAPAERGERFESHR